MSTATAPLTDDVAGSAGIDVPLRWLDDATPNLSLGGVTCGVPLRPGVVPDAATLRVVADDGTTVPAQTWPLAAWPDGSVKWAGVALGAGQRAALGYRVVAGGEPSAATGPEVSVVEHDDEIVVDTGAAVVVVGRSGPDLVRSLRVGDVEVARAGRLVSSRQDHPEPDHRARQHAVSVVRSAVVEQSGPVRAVVKVTGVHRDTRPADDTGDADGTGAREWLPFTVRLVLAAGAETFRVVHSFVWDGDPEADFLTSLGLRFDVPLRAAAYDRHVRLAGADGGLVREAVQGITGLRRDPGAEVRAAQVAGRATPPLDTWDDRVTSRLHWVPAWSDWSLRQLSANGFTVHKRTAPDRPWIDVAQGTRAEGLAYLGDTSGGIAVGLAGFWQSHPTGIDVEHASSDVASLTTWLWSPDAAPMDLRFYHDGLGQDTYDDQLDALEITYEDYEPGFGSAHGIGRTHELTVTAYAATPEATTLADLAAGTATRPQLVPTPEALHDADVLGDWDLVDRSTPERSELEDRLATMLDFYVGQVDQRSWYGFWNFGDVMHAYDADRHVWRYDVGGYAWDNSELSPDLWLWTSFLRTGRADVFRLAERMTRHTGDVDVYHAGPWQGLGSRHNVQHWGCSAKQVRISTPAYRRTHHFLTGDEHTRDLMLELRDSDRNFLGLDPTRKVRPDAATYAPRRDALAVGLGTDWSALAATWLADWELTGNARSRDRLLGTMADIGALPHGFYTGEALYDLDTGRFDVDASARHREAATVSHLSAVFGLVEICSELVSLVDAGLVEAPGFREAWLQYCRLYLASDEEQEAELGARLVGTNLEQAHSRLAAYAAERLGDDGLADSAWKAYFRGGEFMGTEAYHPVRILPPETLVPIDEARTLSTNDAAQCSLATIQNLALIGHRLPAAD